MFARLLQIWAIARTIERNLALLAAALCTDSSVDGGTKALLFPEIAPKGFTSVLLVVGFFGSINLFAAGIVGEYVAKIFEEVKQRPLFIQRSIIRDGEIRLTAGKMENPNNG